MAAEKTFLLYLFTQNLLILKNVANTLALPQEDIFPLINESGGGGGGGGGPEFFLPPPPPPPVTRWSGEDYDQRCIRQPFLSAYLGEVRNTIASTVSKP